MDPPRTLATGARRVPIVLIREGDQRYPWGVERTDAAALSDPAFIDSLIGLPVKIGIDDVAHPGKVRVGVEDGSARGGTILSARYDPEERAIVGVISLDTPEGLSALARGVRGASLSYDVEMDPTPLEGGIRRRARLHTPDHVLLTRSPRGGPGVGVRADSAHRADACEIDVPARNDNADGGAMDWDPTEWPSYRARMDAVGADVESLKGRMDSYAARMDAAEVSLKKWAEQEAKEPEHRADATPATAGVWRAIFTAADLNKVEIPPGATLVEARRAVAATIVGKERADSLSADALDVAIEAAGKARRDAGPTALDWLRSAQPVRVDIDPATGAQRQDATVNTSPLRGA
jgi:hypothetical protein